MANQQLRDQLEDYKNRQHKNRRLKRISFIVAMCLVAVAIVALVLPGVTLEYGKTSCGKEEHVHTEQCYTQQLACNLPAKGHVHTASCYDDFGALACGQEAAGHIHLASCYDTNGKLTCGQEETVHMHTTACVDPATNTLVCNTAEAAHVHGETCYALQDGAYVLVCQQPSVGHVHTAVCLDENGQVVCGQKEAIEVEHVHDDTCYVDELVCGKEEHTHNELCYDEITQSIMKNEEKHETESSASESAEGDAVDEAATGDADLTDGEIAEAKDQGLLFENDAMIVAFDVPDDIKDKVVLKVTEGAEADAAKAAAENGSDPQAGNAVEGQPESGSPEGYGSEAGDANASAGDAAGNSVGNVTINEQVNIDEQNADNAASGTAAGAEEPVWATNLYIQATLDDKPVSDISELGITAKVQMKPAVIAPILNEINYDEVADEIKDETGAEVTIAQLPMNVDSLPISERPQERADEFVVTDLQNAAYAIDVTGSFVSASVNSAPNPKFNVSYFADLEVVESSSSSYNTQDQLTIIDTSGANLPTNATKSTTPLKYVKIEPSSAGYSVATKTEETEIYSSDKELEYRKAPNLNYFNKLYENGHYMLTGIYTKGRNATEWTEVCSRPEGIVPGDVHFTNRPETHEENPSYILITDGMDIKLKFATTSSDFGMPATFYDYDVTDGLYQVAADVQNGRNKISNDLLASTNKEYFVNTNRKGINSTENYSGDGAAYGFGNISYGTGINEAKDAAGFYVNKANSMSVKGDHGVIEKSYFGLVEGIDYSGESSSYKKYDADTVEFASGISAPKLFGDTQAAGKTKVGSVYSIGFDRVGDTYEIVDLSKGKQQVLGNLDSFRVGGKAYGTNSTLATNDFWPLDDASGMSTYGVDAKFGRDRNGGTNVKYQRIEPEAAADNSRWKWYSLNVADNGNDHNNYFGMVSQVDFELASDYIGPLEYFFFGDDDMWVFLMQIDENGNVMRDTTRLICDIGGVHQMTGSVVNLRDYLPNGSQGHYALRFYYTERGASGSTCYMRYTLPSVSNSTPEQDTGTIQVEKIVDAPEGSDAFDEEFEFTVDLFGPNEQRLPDDYAYNKYDATGHMAGGDLILHTGGTFTLKHGEKVVIKYLPVGTTYTIKEVRDGKPVSIENGGFRPSFKYYVDSTIDRYDESSEFTGTIVQNDSAILRKVVFKNERPYELPATGGIGTYWYWIGGGLLVAVALVMWRRRPIAAAATSGASSAGIARNAADGVCQGTRTRVPNEPRVGNKGVTSSVESECSYGKGDSSNVRQDE